MNDVASTARDTTGSVRGATSGDASVDVSRDGVSVSADNQTRIKAGSARNPELGIDLNASNSVDVTLKTDALRNSVETVGYEVRDSAVAFAREGRERGQAIAEAVKTRSADLRESAQQRVEKAMDNVDKARDRLDSAITKAGDATENRWDNAREELAERYEQFAEALDEARETALKAGVKFEGSVTASVDGRENPAS